MIRHTGDKMGQITLFQTHISIFTIWDFAATFLKVKDRPAVQHNGPRKLFLRPARSFSIAENVANSRPRITNCRFRISSPLQRNLHIEMIQTFRLAVNLCLQFGPSSFLSFVGLEQDKTEKMLRIYACNIKCFRIEVQRLRFAKGSNLIFFICKLFLRLFSKSVWFS